PVAPIDTVGALGFRLTELAVHNWDVVAATDTCATIAPEAVPLLVAPRPTMVGRAARRRPHQRRPRQGALSQDLRRAFPGY
ncbi:MAG: hypothetical protein ACRDNS_13665, partial [Trebonia sp.]